VIDFGILNLKIRTLIPRKVVGRTMKSLNERCIHLKILHFEAILVKKNQRWRCPTNQMKHRLRMKVTSNSCNVWKSVRMMALLWAIWLASSSELVWGSSFCEMEMPSALWSLASCWVPSLDARWDDEWVFDLASP
jgi:hypothetical protein